MSAAALDISPNSIKYLDGSYDYKGCLPQSFDEVFLDKGVIDKGFVVDEDALVAALKELRLKHKREFVFVAIPENALYLYTMYLKGRPSKASVLQQIEFTFSEYVPIALEDSVYDFDVVQYGRDGTLISITVAPKSVVQKYERALYSAGFKPRSIELEAYAVVRSVTSNTTIMGGVEMIVDIGYNRAGIIIARNGLPIFTITIPGGSKSSAEVIDECKKQFLFWDTRTNKKGRRVERVSGVTVCGGSAIEFAKSLRDALTIDVQVANVWQNLFNTEDYIPNIQARESLAMATLAGLLLNNKN
jgi:Tfp pilus assembly PilM family ATPase